MAGESPDRSKQRESSEEPTSGSAGPVPEARTEASEPRDPRLPVAREDAKRSAGAAGSRGGVDTATRVLSVREAEAEAEAEASGEDRASEASEPAGGSGAADTPDPSAAPEKSDASGGGPPSPAVPNDGRLRDAVAAWVATADERAAADARGAGDAETPAEGAEGGQDGPQEDSEKPEEADGDAAAGSAGTGSGPASAPGSAPGGPARAASGPDPASGSTSGPASGPASGSSSGSTSGSDSGPASGPASGFTSGPASGPASGFTSGPASGPASGFTSGPASGPTSGSTPGSTSGSDSGPASGSSSGSTSGSDSGPASGPASGSTPGPASGSSSGSTPGPASGFTSGSTSGLDSDGVSAPVAASGSDTGPLGDAGPASGSAPVPASASGSDADRSSDPAPGPASGTDAASDRGSASTAASGSDDVGAGTGAAPDADADADTRTDASEPGSGSGPGVSAGEVGERQVDQPTAVFKAPRPAVDQATTTLKLGDAAAASRKGGQGAGAGRSDGDAERTSKFVALRHPDDPATRKPPQPPQTSRAQSTATEAPKAPQTPRTGPTAAVPHVGPDRTTQQPLPPKPPLDLLAELTNTPPPPQTPLRTTVRRVKIWTPLVILLLIAFGVAQSMRPLPAPTLDLTAKDSFTFDGGKPEIPWPSSGQAALDVQGIGSFGSSGDQKPVPIASVAKVMTAYVILRDHSLKSGAEGPEIRIDQAAEDQSQAGQESTVNVFEGDSISQREALESILIASANNVARLLARWDAGSEKAFVEKMNAAAKDLGMTNTTYTDPSGLDNTTVSTAVDQVKLAKEAMKQPAFREVATMMSYDDYKGVNHSNWNHLVGHNDVVGIKTGTTTSALGNLVFAAKKEVGGETRTIIGAVVRQPAGGPDNTILGAALDSGDKLIRAAQDTLKSSTILEKGSIVGYVDDGLGGRTPVVATQDVKAVGWGGLTVKLTFDGDEVPHTAKAGTEVGTLTVGDGGTSGAVKVPVALRDDLVEPGFPAKLTRLG
ncbi:D-alanyl-D-alanine carboxypeptidase [Streptomyces sp. NPDC048392]|uniref:D-alanyl-D-alanine carboxypeptidase n=1 Tax=Streptomyces sp. NPDC048392 TaxID=3365543 RepID=UPI003719C7D8